MAKVANFKFGMLAPSQSPNMTPKKFAKRGRAQGHVTPIFWALYANSSQMAKGANFKFSTHDPRQSSNMAAEKNSQQTHWNFKKPILVAMVTKIWEF